MQFFDLSEQKKTSLVFLDNAPVFNDRNDFGSTKEAYEGDTVSLSCSDENPRGRYSRVIFAFPPVFSSSISLF